MIPVSPFHLPADGGEWHSVVGDACRTLVSTDQSGGAFCLVEIRVNPGGGPPLHIHRREEETFFILDGEVEFTVADRTLVASTGDTVFGPRGIPHRYQNRSNRPARFLVLATPGGLDHFFSRFSCPMASADAPPTPPSPEVIGKLLAAAAEFGLEILPPPATEG